LLKVIGLLVGGTAEIAKTVNDNKAMQCQLEALKRHNRVMKSRRVYFVPHKNSRGVLKKKFKETLKIPKDVTTTIQPHVHSIF